MSSDTKALFAILRPYAGRYALGGLILLLCDLCQLAAPYLVGRIIDGLRAHALTVVGLERYSSLLVGAAAAAALCRFGWRQFVYGTARMVERGLRERLYAHLQTLSASFYGRRKVGDLMAHATNDVQAIRAIAGEGVLTGLDPVFYIASALAMMIATVNWRLTLLCLLPFPVMGLVNNILGRQVHRRYRRVQEAFSSLSDRVQEVVSGIRVVKGFVQEEPERRRFAALVDAYRQRFMAMERLQSAFDPSLAVLSGSSSAIALIAGGSMVRNGTLTLGQLVSFFGYLNMLSWPMLAISRAYTLLSRATASMGRLRDLFETVPEVTDAPNALDLSEPLGGIAVRKLTFSYSPDLVPALSDVSLELAPGQVLGVVGRTGSGKSTLVSLLSRVFDPPSGTVFVDGMDVLDLKLADLRAAIGYVPQDAFLFSRSLATNVDFATPEKGLEAVWRALEIAAIADEAQALQDGLDTLVGERGVMLSGGQRQRVTMARALVRDPRILVLDDCLSAVDARTEAQILAGLAAFVGQQHGRCGRTAVLVAHRLSVVRRADLIVFLDGGRVVERGTHRELLELGGLYAGMWRQQQAEAALALDT
ncbi:MAG: ABC transporter ATP-binding protein/permease [Cyanobacteria bacterium REEB65]|nr:ABC transporter ATP-binding protein/permease [Cyanobacteria bacterium REEB65]